MKCSAVAALVMTVLFAHSLPAAESPAPYQELPFPPPVETGTRIEVREFFWYGCPHCYTLEPVLNTWLKKLPAHAGFVRTPGAAPHWLVHAQAYYALESLGALGTVHEPLFKAIQTDRRGYGDEASLTQFVASQGVNAAKFREAFRSFGVRLKVERAKKLNSEYMVSSVPTLVVDGKYLTSPSMAGGEEAMLKLVDQLIERARRERAGRK